MLQRIAAAISTTNTSSTHCDTVFNEKTFNFHLSNVKTDSFHFVTNHPDLYAQNVLIRSAAMKSHLFKFSSVPTCHQNKIKIKYLSYSCFDLLSFKLLFVQTKL
jgi:hypothetical protein